MIARRAMVACGVLPVIVVRAFQEASAESWRKATSGRRFRQSMARNIKRKT